MTEVKSVVDIASRHLGQTVGEYSDTYDKSLLVSVPRYMNREAYDIKENNLPFTGYDIWNAYEVSAVTKYGRPVSGVLKIVYPSDSEFHVESKSIKLYLNSLNMHPFGETAKECTSIIENIVKQDLESLLNTEVITKLHTINNSQRCFADHTSLDTLVDLDNIKFDTYKSDSQLLTGTRTGKLNTVKVYSDMLRSNCRVTNQPDWGDVYIHIKSHWDIDYTSLAKYIVSHRKVSHFHEEICEMVFKHLQTAYTPEELMVCCLYTRRGGIDINPIRATHKKLIPHLFTGVKYLNTKTLRQ